LGSYQPGLVLSAVLAAAAAFVFLLLPRYDGRAGEPGEAGRLGLNSID
jgi:hypothetical protein